MEEATCEETRRLVRYAHCRTLPVGCTSEAEVVREVPVTVEVPVTIEASREVPVTVEVNREVPVTVEVVQEVPVTVEATKGGQIYAAPLR